MHIGKENLNSKTLLVYIFLRGGQFPYRPQTQIIALDHIIQTMVNRTASVQEPRAHESSLFQSHFSHELDSRFYTNSCANHVRTPQIQKMSKLSVCVYVYHIKKT